MKNHFLISFLKSFKVKNITQSTTINLIFYFMFIYTVNKQYVVNIKTLWLCCLISGNIGVAILRLLDRFSFQAIANAFFSVDSFFFLRYMLYFSYFSVVELV